MESCPTVSMDRYWNYVATPLFFFIILFGVYVLFNLSAPQLATTAVLNKFARAVSEPIFKAESELAKRGAAPRKNAGTSMNAANAANGANTARANAPPAAAAP